MLAMQRPTHHFDYSDSAHEILGSQPYNVQPYRDSQYTTYSDSAWDSTAYPSESYSDETFGGKNVRESAYSATSNDPFHYAVRVYVRPCFVA